MHASQRLQDGIRPISKASHNAYLPETDSEGWTLPDGHCLWKRYSSNSNLNIKTKTRSEYKFTKRVDTIVQKSLQC